MKTIRLMIGDWQAGAKEEYFFGNKLLGLLAPANDTQKTIVVEIATPDGTELPMENGVAAQQAVLQNVHKAKVVISKEQPDKIITLGGNCLVSQAPFDYLNGKYGERLGILWLDAHPDISTPQMFYHEHAMVIGNLLGHGDPLLAKETSHPITPEQLLYIGLQPLTDAEYPEMDRLGINYEIQDKKMLSIEKIQQWIKEHAYTKIAIHWDIDVIDPTDFHSQYFAEPGVPMFDESSHGRALFQDVVNTLNVVQDMAEVVGFTLAEYLPWDAIRIQRAMAGLKIFSE